MAKCGYSVEAAKTALAAAATQTVLAIKSNAAFGIDVTKWGASFDGSAAATGIQVQLCTWDATTGTPGTNSTSVTPTQEYGRVIAHGITAASFWTTEPTVLTIIENKIIQQSGAYEWNIPLGQTPDSDVSKGFAIRIITPSAVSPGCTAFFKYERC